MIIRYLISGVTCNLLEFSFFNLLNLIFFVNIMPTNNNLVISNILSCIFGFIISYISHRVFVFRSKQDIKKEIFRYAILFTINVFLSTLLLVFFTDTLGIPSYISKFLSMGITAVWNFISYKLIIFKVKEEIF